MQLNLSNLKNFDDQVFLNLITQFLPTQKNTAICLHSSFSRLGTRSSPLRILKRLQKQYNTLLLPAFTWDSSTGAPMKNPPSLNGIDYSVKWNSPKIPFDPLHAGINSRMGILSKIAWKQPGAKRSEHPWHSWVSIGAKADWLTRGHEWDRAHQPLERLAAINGWVLLLGVSLKYCTAFHLAEEMAGRQPFIRWAIDRTGTVRQIRVGGCANWFENFEEPLRPILYHFWIGRAKCTAFPLHQFLKIVSNKIRLEPTIAVCSKSCLKCFHAFQGGPKR